MYSIRIPMERIGVLIGKNGSVKEEIERISNTVIKIDSSTGEVIVDDSNITNPEMGLRTRDVIRAIGRGFSPERAFRLFDPGTYLEIIDIKEFVGKNSKRAKTVRGRLIGSGGKTRRLIEEMSESYVSIYGNTACLIGDYIQNEISRESILMILRGNQHSTVYKYLERRRRDLRLSRLDSI
ncbi:MAG: KH domain-containing protein [Thermoplasmatales archaeon]